MKSILDTNDYRILLTQYKRSNLEQQLKSIRSASIDFKKVTVYQNEDHVDLAPLKLEYNFQLVKSDFNTKFFGRFYHLLNYSTKYCLVLDDDVIPETNFFHNIFKQCKKLNSIITGNGRLGYYNKNIDNLVKPNEYGNKKNFKVDFGGHAWCFKKDWLHSAFSIKPYTQETGEDMHLCYSLKILDGLSTYTYSGHKKASDIDSTKNALASDEFSSYKTTDVEKRKEIEKFFIENYGLELIKDN